MKFRKLAFIFLVLALLWVVFAIPGLAQDTSPDTSAEQADTPQIPTVPVTEPTKPEDGFVPEASSLLLLGSGAAGLAGYISLQVRARRRK